MKLWILEAREGLPNGDNPFNSSCEIMDGIVVRAESEEQARQIAQIYDSNWRSDCSPWINQKYTSCKELTSEGGEGCIIASYN